MKSATSRSRSWNRSWQDLLAIGFVVVLLFSADALLAQEKTEAPADAAEAAQVPPEQLDALVAPIALYPDELLAQTLVASTYPLEIIQLQQWLAKNPDLKDQALADAVAKQPWDSSIQSMAAVPEVVKRLADDIQWTTDLGNAFLAQQADIMDAVQRMRKKAQANGALENNEQQKVETQVVKQDTVIVVQSTTEVIYVPSYSPVVVYGPPIYPYPPIYYPPPPPPGAAFVAFSFGVAMGAAYWGGPCCGCGWGGNDIYINRENNFNQINNVGGGGGNWQHNPEHRGAAPYADKTTANKYGGSARGTAPSNRASAAQQPAGNRGASAAQQPAGNRGASAAQQPAGNRGASAAQQPAGNRGASAAQQPAGNRGASAAQQPAGNRGASAAQQPAGNRGASAAQQPAGNRQASGGGDQIGNRSIPPSSGSKASTGFSGGSSGYSGSSARASSSRGSSSMGSRGGGGGRGGGGRR